MRSDAKGYAYCIVKMPVWCASRANRRADSRDGRRRRARVDARAMRDTLRLARTYAMELTMKKMMVGALAASALATGADAFTKYSEMTNTLAVTTKLDGTVCANGNVRIER